MVAVRLLPILALIAGAAPLPERVEFNRDVRPILSDNCFKCHGPDKNQRKGDLRLDVKEGLFGADGPVIPGKADKSELYQRLIEKDPDRRMPMEASGKKLTGRQIPLLKL